MVTVKKAWHHIKSALGIDSHDISTSEKLVATIGAFLGITAITYISYQTTGLAGAALIVPSMGASAVLVFAVPHGQLSQPWALIGGNTLSAIVGVTCFMYIPNLYLATGIAVSIAIGVMHITKCLHPPGGASALAAVVGGPAIHDLGYQYVLTPVLLNTLIIFSIAVAFNYMFPWRRYPTKLMSFKHPSGKTETKNAQTISKNHIEQAVSELNSVIDISTTDLQHLVQRSLEISMQQSLSPNDIILGHYYANGLHGGQWSVRQVIDESASDDPSKDLIIFQVVEGHGLRNADSCTRREFAQWASHEAMSNNRPSDKSF